MGPDPRLNCRETENLLLTDDVLAKVDLDWQLAQSKIADANCDESHKARFLAISRIDRMTVDLKGLLPTIESVLFPNMGRWTRIVGNVLGPQRPEGDLLDFIGEQVVTTLYGPQDVIVAG